MQYDLNPTILKESHLHSILGVQLQTPDNKRSLEEARDHQLQLHEASVSRGREEDEEEDNFLAEDEQDAKCIVCGKDGEQIDNTLLRCSNESCWHLVHHQCSMPCTDPDVLGVLCTRCTPERDDHRYYLPLPPPNTCAWMQFHTRMYLHCTCWLYSNM